MRSAGPDLPERTHSGHGRGGRSGLPAGRIFRQLHTAVHTNHDIPSAPGAYTVKASESFEATIKGTRILHAFDDLPVPVRRRGQSSHTCVHAHHLFRDSGSCVALRPYQFDCEDRQQASPPASKSGVQYPDPIESEPAAAGGICGCSLES